MGKCFGSALHIVGSPNQRHLLKDWTDLEYSKITFLIQGLKDHANKLWTHFSTMGNQKLTNITGNI